MQKIMILIVYLLLAMIASGLFGMIHDQISYTVSNEYFTQFKFIQFRLLDAAIPERIRAAQVGWLASWWMGIPLGMMSGLLAWQHKHPKHMIKALLIGLLLMITTTLIIALIGLAYGYYQTTTLDITAYQTWFIPNNITNLREFICAGYMHNAAYLGGGLSLIGLALFHATFKQKSKAKHQEAS